MPCCKLMLTKWYNMKAFAARYPRLMWGALLGGAGLLYLKVWLPVTNLGIPCVFHEVTGLFCPGCGITRALVSLLSLDLMQSFRYHPLIYILIPLYGVYMLTKRKGWRSASKLTMGTMLTLTILFGILRNIPYFAWLAPSI